MQNKLLSNIRAEIARRDLKKKTLARKLKISRSLLSLYLHGDKPLTPEIQAKIVKALDLDTNSTQGV